VYVYFLVEGLIPYPKAQSNILYIGEAMRESEATGVRFRQHITPTAEHGADTGSNFTLSQYFHAGWKVGLSIFQTDCYRTDRERDLIYGHISLFGAPPIAQGKIPNGVQGRNRTTHLADHISKNEKTISDAKTLLMEIVAKYEEPASKTARFQATSDAIRELQIGTGVFT
jgi:hypothetical protein